MKKVVICLVAMVAISVWAELDNKSFTLDISKDPVGSDTVYWYGGEGGILIPAHTSANVKVQKCTDLGIGGLDTISGIAPSDYVLLLYCAETAAVTVLSDHSPSANDFNANDTCDNFSDTTMARGYGFDLAAGTNVFFTHADDAAFDPVSVESFTFGCTFKHNTISTASDYIVNKCDGSGNTETGWAVWMDSTGKIAFYCSDDGGANNDTVITTSEYDDDAEYDLIVTREAGANMRIYVNGSQAAVTAVSNSDDTLANASAINIGALKASSNLWDGHLDNIFFIDGDYPSATEVQTYYARMSGDIADVQGCILDTTASAGYLDIGEYLAGYKGYIRLLYSAVQAADETSTLYYTREGRR